MKIQARTLIKLLLLWSVLIDPADLFDLLMEIIGMGSLLAIAGLFGWVMLLAILG